MDSKVVYSVDASDTIIRVNEAWTTFASANKGEALLPPGIVGRVLWDYISDDATRQIYRRLLARVREGAGPVQFAFRCDSPGLRRLLEMNIVLDSNGEITFIVEPLVVEDREPVTLLDTDASRTRSIVRMCAWCKRLPGFDGRWLEVEEGLSTLGVFSSGPMPTISHGICPECSTALTRSLDTLTVVTPVPIILGGPSSTLRPQ